MKDIHKQSNLLYTDGTDSKGIILSLLVPLLLYIAIVFLLFSAYWPGAMTTDSLIQYGEALSRSYSDWNPPIMAWVWSWLLQWKDGPQLMLLFHFFMLFSAIALLYWTDARESMLSWLWLLLPVSPFVASISGVIWKDVGMAYAFFLAFALFHLGIRMQSYSSYMLFVLAFFFFLYAFLLRANAIMAAAPIIYYSCKIFYPEWQKIKTFIISCSVLGCLFFLGKFINNSVLGAEKTNPTLIMQIDEIAATSRIAQKKLFFKESPAYEISFEELPLVNAVKGNKIYGKVKLSDEVLRENWYWVIKEEPWAYLQAKWELFKNFSGFSLDKRMIFFFDIWENDYGLTFEQREITTILRDYLMVVKSIPLLFLPIFWIPIAGILFFLALKKNNRIGYEIRMLSGSALCYYLGYVLVTPTPEYRFIYWIVLSTIAATILLLCNSFQRSSHDCK